MSKVKSELDKVYDNLEFTRTADKFIGIIREHYLKKYGKEITKAEVLEISNKILEKRA